MKGPIAEAIVTVIGSSGLAISYSSHRRLIVISAVMTKRARMEENVGALSVELTADDLREIEKRVSHIHVVGERLPGAALKMTGR